MRLGYVIVYVSDVAATVHFYERAFGMQRRFVHESGQYAEMETGDTALGFAAETMASLNGAQIVPNAPGRTAAGFELCLVSDDPDAAYATAVGAGAAAVHPVDDKPWGQRVGHVRDCNGCLVELCSPVRPV